LIISNIFIHIILAIGVLSIICFVENVQAQTNATNTTSSSEQSPTAQTAQNQTAQSANQTISKETQAFMALDIPEIKDNLKDANDALANNDTEDALTIVTDLENQFMLLEPKPSFLENIQKIKESISKADINKALDDLSKVQAEVLKADTEMLKAQLSNPELMQKFYGSD
jgi:hypothetical protein